MTLPLPVTGGLYGTNPDTDVGSMVTGDTNITIQKGDSELRNSSVPSGCNVLNVVELGFVPWDNVDSLFSLHTEFTVRRVAQNSVAVLFLIGGPANIINMAVFRKQGLQDRVNLCLFSLALADLLYLAVAVGHYAQQLITQFTSSQNYGPVMTFVLNNNLIGFLGFQWVSQFLTAIIATDRCLCVLSPLKVHSLFSTRKMVAIIVVVFVVNVGLFFVVAMKYRIACVFDPLSGSAVTTLVTGELYHTYEKLIKAVDGFVFGGIFPATVTTVIVTTTLVTTVRLRQIVRWRTETSSAMSVREVALTKMLVANSVFFIVCLIPDALFRFACVFLPEMNLGRRNHNFFMAVLWLVDILTYINSSFNIFVYYAMGSRYRDTFWALFGSQRQTDDSEKSTIDTIHGGKSSLRYPKPSSSACSGL